MANLHGAPDTLAEMQACDGDLLPACIISQSFPTAPPSGLSLPTVTTVGYVRVGSPTRLCFVSQGAATITLTGTDGTYYVALMADTWTPQASWTRTPGTHYMWRSTGTYPPDPPGGLVFLILTVAGGNITVVTPVATLSSLPQAWRSWLGLGTMATQQANAVDITGGTVQNLTYLSTAANADIQAGGSYLYVDLPGDNKIAIYSALLAAGGTYRWFLRHDGDAPSHLGGALEVVGPVQAAGVTVPNAAAGNNQYALYSGMLSAGGTYRWYLRHDGDAPSYLGGHLQLEPTRTLLLGTPTLTPTHNARLEVSYLQAGPSGIVFKPNNDTPSGGAACFFVNAAGTFVGAISTTASATAYGTSSDQRLKHAVQALGHALSTIQALKPVRFRWNADDSADEGFLAHELQQVIPHAVIGLPDEVNPDGSIRPQQIDHSKLVVWLVGAVQELAARLQTIEEQLGI